MQAYRKLIYWGLLVVFLVGLIGYIYVGFSSLMMADDYCFLSVVGEAGFIQSQIDTYTKVVVIAGNRFAATFTIALLSYFGEGLIPVFPLITIITLFIALTFTIAQTLQYFVNRKEFLLSAVLAAFFTNILLYIAPSHFQNIYWFAGIITYTTPLVIFLYLIGIYLYCLRLEKRPVWLLLLMWVIGVFSAGFSETAAVAFFVCILFLFILLMMVAKTEKWALWKITPILGIVFGMVLLILSPAGRLRASSTNSVDLAQLENGLWILTTSLRFGADFIKYTLSGLILPMIVSFFSFAAFGHLLIEDRNTSQKFRRKQFLTIIFLLLSIYFIVAASISPSVFAFSTYPNLRSRMVGIFFLLGGIALIAFCSGYYFPFRSQVFWVGVVVALIFTSVYVIRASWIEQDYKAELQTRKNQWVLRNESTENVILSGEDHVTVFGIDSIETVEDFNPVCFRKYYGPVYIEVVNK